MGSKMVNRWFVIRRWVKTGVLKAAVFLLGSGVRTKASIDNIFRRYVGINILISMRIMYKINVFN